MLIFLFFVEVWLDRTEIVLCPCRMLIKPHFIGNGRVTMSKISQMMLAASRMRL